MLALSVVLLSALYHVSAAPGLSLHLGGPESVTDVDNLVVKATVENTGDVPLRLFNDPNGPLSTRQTDTFAITSSASGRSPSFSGIKVKYGYVAALASGDSSAFTVLQPGQSIAVDHKLAGVYNFTTSGAGAYSLEANNLFHYVSDSGAIAPIHASVTAHELHLSGKLASTIQIRRPIAAVSKRASFVGCSSTRQTQLNQAASAAQSYAGSALSYLQSHTSSTTRYTTWFGAFTTSRHSTVQTHFTNLNSNSYASYTYDCTCTDAGTYAFVFPDDFGYVTLCGAFWQAPLTGTDSKGGTLIHESSHFTKNAGTDDHVYGQSGCKSLALSSPTQAIDNADSHEYFAENNPVQS